MIPKFRAWDKECMEMANVTDISYKGNWVVDEPHVALDTRCDLLPFDEVELMQSTGLKDKNGVEIFEGDIVLFSVSDGFNHLDHEKAVVQASVCHSGLICKLVDLD
ncbi:YopX family protein, partial [Enterococcus hirae]|uniref:YopX family protein n=1 Tax=Enterococcus hirae TaxID=1354 RepID=UPI0013777FEB